MATRKELIAAVGQRYREASKNERGKILDEFAVLAQYHRKHAIRVLAAGPDAPRQIRPRNRLYDEAVRQALIVLWEAADRLCGKRLKALIPLLVDAMERHGHLRLDPTIRSRLLGVSAATIDRALRDAREQIDGQRKRRAGVGAAIRRSIPVRTFAEWRDPPPGGDAGAQPVACGAGPGKGRRRLALRHARRGHRQRQRVHERNGVRLLQGTRS
jgi:hypothetical protein